VYEERPADRQAKQNSSEIHAGAVTHDGRRRNGTAGTAVLG